MFTKALMLTNVFLLGQLMARHRVFIDEPENGEDHRCVNGQRLVFRQLWREELDRHFYWRRQSLKPSEVNDGPVDPGRRCVNLPDRRSQRKLTVTEG